MSDDSYDGRRNKAQFLGEFDGSAVYRLVIREPTRAELRKQRETPDEQEARRKKKAASAKAKAKKWRDKNPDYGKNYMREKRAAAKAKKKEP